MVVRYQKNDYDELRVGTKGVCDILRSIHGFPILSRTVDYMINLRMNEKLKR